jgi:hypothetical protein
MTKKYHILNGSSLKEQFPISLAGEIIVAKECLADGTVDGENLDDLFTNRAGFISRHYDGYTKRDYYKKTVPEFNKIQAIPQQSEINLWFEHDLFCQVNFWFVSYMLCKNNMPYIINFVSPLPGHEYSFGSMTEPELIKAFETKIVITKTEINQLSTLWKTYQKNNFDNMLKTAKSLNQKHPFLLPAINAHIDRLPKHGTLGRIEQSILKIMADLNTNDFDIVFKEFNKRDPIYGFGDLQIKRLFEKIKLTTNP